MTLIQLDSYLKQETGISAYARKSALRIVQEIGVEKFETSNQAEWLAAYRRARPNASIDLGRERLGALKTAQAAYRVLRERAATEAANRTREAAERRAREEAEAKAKAEHEDLENPRFSRPQIKALADFMELSSVESVDLKLARDFIRAFTVKE